MSAIINSQQTNPADILLNILQALPPQKAEQLINFARFLEAQQLDEELLAESEADIMQDNEAWDALVTSEKSQILLAQLAREALGNDVHEMSFDQEGRIIPK